VPNTGQEAKAQIQEMAALGVKRLYVADDGTDYGKAAALAVRTDAGSGVTISSSQSGADAMYYAATPADAAAAARTLTAAAAANPSLKLFGPSGLDTATFLSALGSSAPPNLYLSAPGFLPKDLTAAGRQFNTDFRSTYAHAPATEAIFGYEAMAAVLDVLHQEGASANDRSKVVKQFFAIRNRSSVLGTYSIDADGDTNLAPFVFGRVRSGRLVPFRFLPVQG
jgi:branched-chain amino acid transport system substrate-binding protein